MFKPKGRPKATPGTRYMGLYGSRRPLPSPPGAGFDSPQVHFTYSSAVMAKLADAPDLDSGGSC
jgi:hypothetical protein